MTYQPITLERFNGRRVTVDLAARRGPLAAVRLPKRGHDVWTIFLVSTPAAPLPYRFSSAAAAEQALYEIDEIDCWAGESCVDTAAEVAFAIIKICDAYGATRVSSVFVQALGTVTMRAMLER